MLFYRLVYRPLMRLAHRFNWHYAPKQPEIEIEDRFAPRLRCQWCGLQGRVYPTRIGGPITIHRPLNFVPSKPEIAVAGWADSAMRAGDRFTVDLGDGKSFHGIA